jgi:hypothetical protein
MSDTPARSPLDNLRIVLAANTTPLGESVRELASVGLYRDILTEAASRAKEQQIEEFFRLIAAYSRNGDIADLLARIATGLEDQRVYPSVA